MTLFCYIHYVLVKIYTMNYINRIIYRYFYTFFKNEERLCKCKHVHSMPNMRYVVTKIPFLGWYASMTISILLKPSQSCIKCIAKCKSLCVSSLYILVKYETQKYTRPRFILYLVIEISSK